MSDDTPLEPINPESEPAAVNEPAAEPGSTPTAAAAPTEPVPVAAAGSEGVPPTWPAPAAAPVPPQSAPPAASSSTIAVPKWVVAVVGALLFALIGFGIGYTVAPGDDNGDQVIIRPGSGLVPPLNNGGGGSGDLPTLPSPSPRTGQSAFLGVATTSSTDPDGAKIERVVDGSPADDAGLKADDVITKVDDESVTSPSELASLIGDEEAGDDVTITYVRDGETKTADVTLKLRNSFQIPSTPSTTRPQS